VVYHVLMMDVGLRLRRSCTMVLAASFAAGLFVAGCAGGHATRVATVTRFRGSVGEAKLPICDSVSAESLAERHWSEICLAVAKKKRMAVATSTEQRCLEASMTWDSEVIGTEADCSRGWGVSCKSQAQYRHTLKLVLADPDSQKPVVESRTWTRSDKADLTDLSVYTLCSAAFFHYPQVMHDEKVAINLDI
jgi:hypothetical protein